jgi:hypothetical protein
MKNILIGVLVAGILVVLYFILQLLCWTLVAINGYIPYIVGACFLGYCYRKFLIYKHKKNELYGNKGW